MTQSIPIARDALSRQTNWHSDGPLGENSQWYQVSSNAADALNAWVAQQHLKYEDHPLPLVIDGHMPVFLTAEDQQLYVVAPMTLPHNNLALAPPPPLDLQAIVFDVDGTLVDSLQAYFALAKHAADHHGLPVEWPLIRKALNENTLNFWELIVPLNHPNRDAVMKDMQQRARKLWPEVLEQRVKLLPGSHSLIKTLADQQMKLGIVTSSGGDAMKPMHDAGLTQHFAKVVTRHDVERRKPDPQGILNVLKTVGVAATKAAYVGDSIMDIRAAHNAGVLAIGLLCGAGDAATLVAEKPHYLFADPNALTQLWHAQ